MSDVSAALSAATKVLTGSGDVRCSCRLMHDDTLPKDLPHAIYVMYCSPCEVPTCVGAVVCVGHGLCVDCCVAIRAGRCVWDTTKDDVELHFVTGRTGRAAASSSAGGER